MKEEASTIVLRSGEGVMKFHIKEETRRDTENWVGKFLSIFPEGGSTPFIGTYVFQGNEFPLGPYMCVADYMRVFPHYAVIRDSFPLELRTKVFDEIELILDCILLKKEIELKLMFLAKLFGEFDLDDFDFDVDYDWDDWI